MIWPVQEVLKLLPLPEHIKLEYSMPHCMLRLLWTETICCLCWLLFGAQCNSTGGGNYEFILMLVGLVAFLKTLWLQEGFYSSIILLRDIFLRVRQSQSLVLMLLIFISFLFSLLIFILFFFLLPSFLPSIVPSFPPSFISTSFLPPFFLPSFHCLLIHFTERWLC